MPTCRAPSYTPKTSELRNEASTRSRGRCAAQYDRFRKPQTVSMSSRAGSVEITSAPRDASKFLFMLRVYHRGLCERQACPGLVNRIECELQFIGDGEGEK